MPILNSISPISHVFQTSGSNPVRVMCQDFNDYVCKYSANAPAKKLLYEYLATSFLNIWGIRTPEAAIVKIKAEHVTTDIISNIIQPRNFHNSCFGSKYYEYAKEIDESFTVLAEKQQLLKKIQNKEDYLKIALFDLWMANEDRNLNNYNLLINPEADGYYFYAIDHEKCFNSGMVRVGISMAQLTDSDTIIASSITPLLFKKGAKLNTLVGQIIEDYYLCVQSCKSHLPELMEQVPQDWGINKEETIELLNNNIFVPNWIEETEQNLKQLLSTVFV